MLIDQSELDVLLKNYDLPHCQVGGETWWDKIRSKGTPLIKKESDKTSLVLFIWQDPQGEEADSVIASVLLDVNSLTDHHSWTPVCLDRISGTDVWLGTLLIDSQWRGSYSFIPIEKHQLPGLVQRTGDGSREAQRAWWMDVAGNQIHDDLNKLPMLVSGWGMSSPLHLPHAPLEVGWKEWEQGELNLISAEHIQTIDWQEIQLGNQRHCWLFSTAIGDAPLVILLDGQKWSAASGALSVLQHLTDTKQLAPAHYLMIPSIDGKTRWKELSCYRPFWQAVIDRLLPMAQAQLVQSNRSISSYVVAGQSLGGLAALFAGVTFPEYFSKIISLSGSFWWPEENRMRTPSTTESTNDLPLNNIPRNSVADHILNDRVSAVHLNVFMTVGLGEKDMHPYNDVTYDAIKQKSGLVRYEKVYGGHDWLSWRSGLVNGLVHLMPA